MGRSGSKKLLSSSTKTRQIILGSGASLSSAHDEFLILKKIAALQELASSGDRESVLGKFKFNGLHFNNVNLSGLDFSRVKIKNTTFKEINFSGLLPSVFQQSEFDQVEDVGSDFSGSDFSGSRFLNSHFAGSNFSQADLSDLDLKNNNNIFDKCNFSDSKLSFVSGKNNSFSGSTFLNTHFQKNNFSGVKLNNSLFTVQSDELLFIEADLSGTKFLNCDLKNPFFGGALMIKTEFENNSQKPEVNKIIAPSFSLGVLNEVSFKNVTLVDPYFNRAYLRSNTFFRSVISDARVDQATFNDVHFRDTMVLNTDFSSSNFSNTKFINCDLTGSRFKKHLNEVEFINCTGGPTQ